MEERSTLPFKESNLNYLSKYSFKDHEAINILQENRGYFLIIERWFIYLNMTASRKSIINSLSFSQRYGFMIFTESLCYFWMKKFKSLLLLYLHYGCCHSEVNTRVHFKKNRNSREAFFWLVELENSQKLEGSYYLGEREFGEVFNK